MSERPAADAVLLDIEGTTTAISFVYDELFPYARRAMLPFLDARFGDEEVHRAVAAIRPEATHSPHAAAAAALALMDADVKQTGLKALQGLIWRDGYASGELKGHVYDDVPEVLRALHERGTPVYIYSSGSVAAQKLLFRHSVAGDLTPLLAGYFDTTTGPKKQADSYAAIAEAIGVDPARVHFVTDNLAEALAAREAGVVATLSVRPGNPPLPEHDLRVVESLRFLLR